MSYYTYGEARKSDESLDQQSKAAYRDDIFDDWSSESALFHDSRKVLYGPYRRMRSRTSHSKT